MIRAKRFSATGRRLPDIHLDLSPTEASLRLFKKFPAIAKSAGIPDTDANFGQMLGKIDAGQLDLGTLMRLFTGAEIIQAIHGAAAKVAPGSDEYRSLMALLRDPDAWRSAQGGERQPDRFGVRRYDAGRESHRDIFGGRSDLGSLGDPETHSKVRRSREEGDLKKSMAREGRLDEAKAHGLRVHSGDGDPYVLMHPKRPGNGELHLQANGDWEHKRRGKVLASGGPAQLRGRLAMFSKDHDED